MNFKEWLIKEVGTSTGDIAGFRRTAIPLVRRMYPPEIAMMYAQDPPGKKKKPYRQPQVQESEGNDPIFDAAFDAVQDAFKRTDDPNQVYQHANSQLSNFVLNLDPVNQKLVRREIVTRIIDELMDRGESQRLDPKQVLQDSLRQCSDLLLMLTPQERQEVMSQVNFNSFVYDSSAVAGTKPIDGGQKPDDQGEYGMGGNWWNPQEQVEAWAKKYNVDSKTLKQGVDVESEHDGKRGKDVDVVGPKEDKAKIATAHLREDPKYYKKLKKIEKKD